MADIESEAPAKETKRVSLKVIQMPEAISVGDLASKIQVDAVQIIKQLMRLGLFASVNEVIDFETAAGVVRAFGYFAKPQGELESTFSSRVREKEGTEERAPIVTILGHVDHGKTTLLDAIRHTNVVSKETGGITQHVGAYQTIHNGKTITFLDTPGHEAFTAIRARGAKVTDIAVLVVAADDGVMPQTAEAISHVKAAGVPIVVAINKMDLPDSDPERVKRQLAEHELLVEDWGGDVVAVPLSATEGNGVEDLLENLLVVAEVAELRADPNQPALGTVVESRIDKSRGTIVTLLVQTGTLKTGDHVVMGVVRGKIRALIDDKGRRISQAGPSTPVEVLGINGVPRAGDPAEVMVDEKSARSLVERRERDSNRMAARGVNLSEFRSMAGHGDVKEMLVIVKTDVQGSLDAVRASLEQISSEATRVRIIHSATGAVTEADVNLGLASQAIVIGFNVVPDQGAKRLADQSGVEIRLYEIIYRLIEDVEAALSGLLEPVIEDILEGVLEVRAIFDLRGNRASAGCFVVDGKITRNSTAKVMRGGKEIFAGSIANLRRFKDDVREVSNGYECGLTLDGFGEYEIGDVIEAHVTR